MNNDVTYHSLLLVEDDKRLAKLIGEYLQKNGFHIEHEYRGDHAVERISNLQPALVILDLMLPGLNGLEVCRQVRGTYTGPILMLTAQDEDVDQIVGLEVGADDYVTKPVEPRVLLARIRTLLRRIPASSGNSAQQTDNMIDHQHLHINAATREVILHNENIKLTTSEFDLLWFLASHAGTILSRDELYKNLSGFEYDGMDRSMDIRISKLRKLLDDDCEQPKLIKTIRGKGYLFSADC